VCCEQIAFAFTGRVTGRFRNTVFGHLNSDLPLVFWWQGELSDVFRERLSSVIDRLVIDSSSWADPAADFARLNEAVASSTLDLVVQDLAWTRTWQYRLSLAGMFDDPIALAALPAIETVRIVHHPKHRSSALQLLAWISVQAGWRSGLNLAAARDGQVETFPMESKAGVQIVATLESDETAAPISLLEVSAPEITLRLSRAAGAAHVLRELITPGSSQTSLAPADPDDDAGLVGSQLARGGKNTLYRKVLPRFLELLAG
jgi:glucose-6-phosphate dehydrogenase assembly protein OpcA